MAASPYRAPGRSIELRRAPRPELVYRAADGHGTRRALAVVTVAATTAGGLVGTVLPALSLCFLGSALALAAWRWRQGPEERRVVLRVDRGVLRVTAHPDRVLLQASLPDVSNVTLDIRTIHATPQADALVPGLGLAPTVVGPELDVARIVIEVNDRPDSIRLSDAYVPHMEGIEWLGRIRRFLRAHGWVPEDERDAPSV
ncbi:MAG: hypothetical protein FWD17_13595 [Polyangiaceae bacterium]|nr:hypothetical protein [Polyangiaceae bacterium]